MSEIIKSSAAAIVVSVSMGAAIWWGVVEVRLANAETLITVNKESITEIKIRQDRIHSDLIQHQIRHTP